MVLFTSPGEIGPFAPKLLFGIAHEASHHDHEVSVWFTDAGRPSARREPRPVS